MPSGAAFAIAAVREPRLMCVNIPPRCRWGGGGESFEEPSCPLRLGILFDQRPELATMAGDQQMDELVDDHVVDDPPGRPLAGWRSGSCRSPGCTIPSGAAGSPPSARSTDWLCRRDSAPTTRPPGRAGRRPRAVFGCSLAANRSSIRRTHSLRRCCSARQVGARSFSRRRGMQRPSAGDENFGGPRLSRGAHMTLAENGEIPQRGRTRSRWSIPVR